VNIWFLSAIFKEKFLFFVKHLVFKSASHKKVFNTSGSNPLGQNLNRRANEENIVDKDSSIVFLKRTQLKTIVNGFCYEVGVIFFQEVHTVVIIDQRENNKTMGQALNESGCQRTSYDGGGVMYARELL